MFKKLYFTKADPGPLPTAWAIDWAICNNSLQLKAVYYSNVSRSFILNIVRGPRPALTAMVFRKIIS